jgi:hypothetical protein
MAGLTPTIIASLIEVYEAIALIANRFVIEFPDNIVPPEPSARSRWRLIRQEWGIPELLMFTLSSTPFVQLMTAPEQM